jgi:hypothetical protein
MVNTTKKFRKNRLLKFENLIYFFFALLIFFGIVNVLTYFNLKESIEDFDIINSSYCEYFIFTPSLQNQIENISIEFSKKEIYVFPDLQNLKCIGKVGEFFLEDNQIKGRVYTNTKLVNLTILLFNLGQIVFHYFMRFHSKRNFYTLIGIGNLFIFLYLYNSINLVSFNLLFVSLLLIYFFDYEN